MRRIAPFGLVLLLPACGSVGDYVGNPFDGFGGFLADSVTINANQPIAESSNAHRVMGDQADVEPLLPETGNIWPAAPRPDPSLADIQKELEVKEPGTAPAVPPRGSSTPPALLQPAPQSRGSAPMPPDAPPNAPSMSSSVAPLPTGTALTTPRGTAIISSDGNGVQTFTLPNGSTGRAINNGNGTMTLIGADGSVQSVPTPR